MKAGDLKHPITLLSYTQTLDGKGNHPKTWVPYATCYAWVSDVSGRDFYAAQAHQALDISTFGIRWRDDVEAAYQIDRSLLRIRHRGQTYEIVHLNRLGYKRDFMHIKAREVYDDGV